MTRIEQRTTHYDLIESWRRCQFEEPPYLFPGDEAVFESSQYRNTLTVHRSFQDYVSSPDFESENDTSLHVGLQPVPYIGDLNRASVFILTLNPSLAPSDYYAEQNSEAWREASANNLYQKDLNPKYPFLGLNPQFAWHPGFEYWHKKLRSLAEAVVEQHGGSYQAALSQLSKRVAVIERLSYHSNSFGTYSLLTRLPSAKIAFRFVHDTLVPQAKNKEVIIIVVRSVKEWGFQEERYEEANIILYPPHMARSASLHWKNSEGGAAIARLLGLRQ